MKPFLLVAAGKDRPGIVAAVTEALYRQGCNLADSSMTRLASEFAMLVIFQSPSHFDPKRLALPKKLGLFIQVKPLRISELARSKPKGRPHIVSVHGADRPGIVYRVSRLLADRKINITDVWTHRTTAKGRSGYVLFLEVELPANLNSRGLERLLGQVATRLKLHVSVQPIESSPL